MSLMGAMNSSQGWSRRIRFGGGVAKSDWALCLRALPADVDGEARYCLTVLRLLVEGGSCSLSLGFMLQ